MVDAHALLWYKGLPSREDVGCYGGTMLDIETSSLGTNTSASQATGADAQIVESNSERNGLIIQAANVNSAPVFLTLVAPATVVPAASAASAHIELAAGQSWTGRVTEVVWTGRVRAFSTAAQVVRITEV